MIHLESISNGFGSQSMALLVLRKRGIVRGDVSMSADTGSENDCKWSTGRRSDTRTFYDEVIAPYCQAIGIKSCFVRTRDKNGQSLPALHEAMILQQEGRDGVVPSFVPMFGSEGGRLIQSCTDTRIQRPSERQAETLRKIDEMIAHEHKAMADGLKVQLVPAFYWTSFDELLPNLVEMTIGVDHAARGM